MVQHYYYDESSLGSTTGKASVIPHRHTVWANLKMSGQALFSAALFEYGTPPLHVRAHTVWCRARRRSHQLPFVLPVVTLPQTSMRFRSAPSLSAGNILQPAALPRTLLTLKVWPQLGGRLKNTHRHSALLYLLHFSGDALL